MDINALALAVVLLNPVRAYFQPTLPVEVAVDRAAIVQAVGGDAAPLHVAMLSPEGDVQASVVLDASAEKIDLAVLFPMKGGANPPPALWDGGTHIVQLLAGEKPVGTPLVVTPLHSPAARIRRNPDGLRIDIDRHVVLHTTVGDMVLALDRAAAPNTAQHFERLVADGFYTNIIFHRVVPGFVIQAGDPTGTGAGGAGVYVDLEPSDKLHEKGTLSMARRGDDINSNGSQFFICLTRERCASLDGKYTAFGEVVRGLEVVDAIAATPLQENRGGRPQNPPVIQSATLIPAPPRQIKPTATPETPSAPETPPAPAAPSPAPVP